MARRKPFITMRLFSMLLLFLILFITGCSDKVTTGSVAIKSVSLAGLSRQARTLDVPTPEYRYIDSGAPDYLTVTLKKIIVEAHELPVTVWSGSEELILTGEGTVDASNIILDNVPTSQITKITLVLDNLAEIQGTLNGDYEDPDNSNLSVNKTYLTKTAYAYNPVTHTFETATPPVLDTVYEGGSAEPMAIWLSGDQDIDGNMSIDTTADFTPDGVTPVTISIFFDLNRLLRFYNGANTSQGSGPLELNDSAYFFCNSVFSQSVAAFFGTPGSIQGYSSIYNTDPYDSFDSKDVPGWMTIIFDADNNILSGILIGDDDNALTIAKGRIIEVSGPATAAFNFTYDISDVTITGFEKVTTLDTAAPDVAWASNINSDYHGYARFTLRFVTQ